MGFHDDSFAWGTIDGGKSDDWFFMPSMRKAGEAALEKWRTQPIGGEVRSELRGQIFDAMPSHPAAQDFAECVRQTHVSWLMESGMFEKKAGEVRYDRAVAQVRRIGYDFHIPTAEITRIGSKLQLRTTVLNQGLAPFYQDWRMELAAIGADGNIEHRWPLDWKIAGLLPGDDPREWKVALDQPEKFFAGLALGVRVINPLPGGKPLRFANGEQDRHAPGWLSLGMIP